MSAELIILTPDNETRRQPLQQDLVSLGRAHANDLCFPDDASLSRRHVLFERDLDGWWATDLGSKNGTTLNGQRLAARQKLRPGDRLAVGHLLITFADDEAGPSLGGVVFYQEPASALRNATVMTSLDGLLSGERTAPLPLRAREAPSAAEARLQAFDSPVVRALIRSVRELSGHRPLGELFSLVLEQSIGAVGAERGVLMTVEGDELVTRAVVGEGFQISTAVRDKVIREKSSLLVRDTQADEAFRARQSISEQRIHTMMAAPLQTEDKVIGLIYVDSRSFVREFGPDDLNLLTVLANVAGIGIERERYFEIQKREELRERDMRQAAEIQRGFLPREAPHIPGIDLAGMMTPCRTVGGDYFDYLTYPDGSLAVVLGDVSGKGMPAALLMSSLKAMVQILAEDVSDLGALTSRLDQRIAATCPTNRFISLFIYRLDPRSGALVYCNAGHNPAFLVRRGGQVEKLAAMGTVLGIMPELGYSEHAQRLDPGDLLALYSDGVTEATNPQGEEFGEQRLCDLLAERSGEKSALILAAVEQRLAEWSAGAPPADDVTLVVVRREA